jgi:chlorophyll/bacteriochlorophyll a synthase
MHLQLRAAMDICSCVQIFFQVKYFLPDPIKNDVKYQASAQPFLVFGLLTAALAVGSSNAS